MDLGGGRRVADALLVGLAVVVLAFAAWVVQREPSRPDTVPTAIEATTDPATPSPSDTASPEIDADPLRVLVLGDESVRGSRSGGRWIGDLGGDAGTEVDNRARPLSGYATDGDPSVCGLPSCLRVPRMLALAVKGDTVPDLVLISAGVHDGRIEQTVLTRAVLSLLDQVQGSYPDAQVVVLSPIVRTGPVPETLEAVTKAVMAATTRAGVDYVDVGQPFVDPVDGSEPTVAQAGEVLAAAVGEAIG